MVRVVNISILCNKGDNVWEDLHYLEICTLEKDHLRH